MTQPNNVEGDYITDIDYGTIDGTQTQSPFPTSGPNEVNFYFHSHLLLKSSVTCFGECEQGRFYPRKYLVWNDTTIRVNRCVFWFGLWQNWWTGESELIRPSCCVAHGNNCDFKGWGTIGTTGCLLHAMRILLCKYFDSKRVFVENMWPS